MTSEKLSILQPHVINLSPGKGKGVFFPSRHVSSLILAFPEGLVQSLSSAWTLSRELGSLEVFGGASESSAFSEGRWQ